MAVRQRGGGAAVRLPFKRAAGGTIRADFFPYLAVRDLPGCIANHRRALHSMPTAKPVDGFMKPGALLCTNWRSAAIALALPGLLCLMPGCVQAPGGGSSKPLVVCTTGQVGDMVGRIGGEFLAVETLMGPGVDPHLYKATPRDRRLLNAAAAVFYNGLHLEGRMSELLENLGRHKPVFAVTDALQAQCPEKLRRPEGAEGVYDPHVWFDVAQWARCVAYAGEKLGEVDPAHAAEYRRRAAEYHAELLALDAEVQKQVATIPKSRRVLVTAHDAFHYFSQAYDIEVYSLQGISTVDEADLSTVNRLVDLLAGRQIKAVFVESSVPARNVQALVQGCQARGHAVRIGGELYSDALGPAGTPEATYVGVVRHNVQKIVEALR